MGTNYYWTPAEKLCPTCGRGDAEEIHVGKSSAGWCFSLHVDPELGIRDLPDWIQRWHRKGSRIRDEYGKEISADEMWRVVMCRNGLWENTVSDQTQDPTWYAKNGAKRGPFGLARHMHHAEPGDGPYDRCTGDFS